MLGVAACYAIGNLYTRTVRHHDPVRLSLGQQMFSARARGQAALAMALPAQFRPIADHLWPVLALGTLARRCR
jgi:hypothetical protein